MPPALLGSQFSLRTLLRLAARRSSLGRVGHHGAAMLVAALACNTAMAASATRRAWTPWPETSYYQGTITWAGGYQTSFRTRDNWVLIAEDATVTVAAFNAAGHEIGRVEVLAAASVKDLTPAPMSPPPKSADTATPAGNAAPADGVGDTDVGFDESVYGTEESGRVATPETADGDDADDLDAQAANDAYAALGGGADSNSGESSDDGDGAGATPADAAKSEAAMTAARVIMTLGVGKEWLDATGGVSNYQGAAGVGGTSVRGEHQRGAWLGVAQLGAHNFSTTVARRDEVAGTESEDESKFLRLSARAAVFYDLFAPAPGAARTTTLGLGLGLGAFRLPVLIATDGGAGVAELELRSAIGPVAGLIYARHLTPLHTAGVEAIVQPTSLNGDVKALGTNVLLFWRYAFVSRLFTELGVVSARERASVPVECGTATACDATSVSTSALVQARMGLGLEF